MGDLQGRCVLLALQGRRGKKIVKMGWRGVEGRVGKMFSPEVGMPLKFYFKEQNR